jgi:hypothetical protein
MPPLYTKLVLQDKRGIFKEKEPLKTEALFGRSGA